MIASTYAKKPRGESEVGTALACRAGLVLRKRAEARYSVIK
jgi:hypothetical protein